MAKITDEQVQEEYNKLLEAEDNLVMQVIPNEKDETAPATDAGSTDGEATIDTPDSLDPTVEEGSETKVPDAAPVEETTVPEVEPEGSGSAGEGGYVSLLPLQETEQVPAEGVPAEVVPSEVVPTEGVQIEIPDTVNNVPTTKVVVPSESAPGSDPTVQESKPMESTAGTDEKTEAAPVETEAAPVETEAAPVETEAAPETTQQSDPVIDDKPVVKREPKALKDVAEDIKRRMVMADARVARDAALDSAEKEIRKFQMLHDRWEFDYGGEKEKTEEPVAPDYQVVADKYGVQFAETGLVDETQIGDEQIGKVVVFDIANRRAIQIADQLFQAFDTVAVFQPLTADDFRDNAKYLYWFSEKVDQKIPTFDEARESIVKYWKRNQAIAAAITEVESIAEKANSNDKLLSDLYPDETVETGGFAWFSKFGRFSYGNPIGVTSPGEEFMETAFSLGQRKAGIAANETRDTVYAIQNVSPLTKSTDQIASDYLKQHFFQTRQIPQEVITAKQLYRRNMSSDWNQEFRKEMDIKVVGQ